MSDDTLSLILAAMTRLEAGQSSMGAEVSSMGAGISSIGIEVSSIISKVSSMDSEISSIRADIMARLDRHQDRLTAIREDMFVNMSRSNHVAQAIDNTREEVRSLSDLVVGMGRQIAHLQARVSELEPKT